ncbi:MAG: RluA family pseudouridine synthase [Blastocatellia bacterium]
MTDQIDLTAPPEAAGTRLDAWLATQLADSSRAAIQRAIEAGDATVNDRVIRASYKLRAGDVIHLELPDAAPLEAQPENIPLDIVHEDAEVIVVNKPAGMVTHPGAGIRSGTLANALVWHFQQLPADAARPGIVHRLDAGTSGLIVVARTERAHIDLARQFESRTVQKTYTALVYGQVTLDEGRIDAPIGRDPRNRVRMAVRPTGDGREALTFYRVSRRFREFSLLDVIIKTGRTHQIRVHLGHLRHPVAGDHMYGNGRINGVRDSRVRAVLERMDRPFLHAARLSFRHPASGADMSFTAPLPAELQSFLTLIESGG